MTKNYDVSYHGTFQYFGQNFITLYQVQKLKDEFEEKSEKANKAVFKTSLSNISLNGTVEECINILLQNVNDPEIVNTEKDHFVAYNDDVFLEISVVYRSLISPFKRVDREFHIDLEGAPKVIEDLYKEFENYGRKESRIEWWYQTDKKEFRSASFRVKANKEFYPEFYPWIRGNVDEYIQRFLNSKESILLLLGPPGTGKTSYVRHLVTSTNSNSYTTYDDDIMSSDEIYINFLNDASASFLILEDADLLLGSRIHDNNRVISKILNAADGIVGFDEKKFIFTANVSEVSKIDDALIRPGRCFDILRFRDLTFDEALFATKKNGLALNEVQDSYTLAEIFNQNHHFSK